jgi:hypothetical protein
MGFGHEGKGLVKFCEGLGELALCLQRLNSQPIQLLSIHSGKHVSLHPNSWAFAIEQQPAPKLHQWEHPAGPAGGKSGVDNPVLPGTDEFLAFPAIGDGDKFGTPLKSIAPEFDSPAGNQDACRQRRCGRGK